MPAETGHSAFPEQWIQSLENDLQSLPLPKSLDCTSDLTRGDTEDMERYVQQETSQMLVFLLISDNENMVMCWY